MRDNASYHVECVPGVLLPCAATLKPRGTFRFIGLDPRTGRERLIGEARNAYTTEGLRFLAAAVAGGTKLNPANGDLRCRIKRTADDTTYGHVFTTGPLTTGAQYQAPQLTSSSDASFAANWLPVRLRWATPTNTDAYALYGVDLLNGSTLLATATITGEAAKRAGEVIIVEYQLDLTASGDVPATTGHAVEALVGGATSAPFAGYVQDYKLSDMVQTYRQGVVTNPTNMAAVVTIAGTWDPATVAGYVRAEYEVDRWEIRLTGLYPPPSDGQPRGDAILMQRDFSPRLAVPAQGLMTFSVALTFAA